MALSVNDLSDREEIREAIYRWSRAVDTSDWDLLRASYTDDVVADFTLLGIPGTTGLEVQAYLETNAPTFTAMQHVLSNITFHELAGDHARTSTLVHATVVPKQGAPFRIGAWYHDELRRTVDDWKICRRRAELVFWSGETPA